MYKLELQKAAEKKIKSTRELKRKRKFDEIENIKKQKLTLQKTIDSLREGLEKETLGADKNQDLGSILKAASFLHTIKEKEKILTELTYVGSILENEYKKTYSLLLKGLEIHEGDKYHISRDLLSHFKPVFHFYTP